MHMVTVFVHASECHSNNMEMCAHCAQDLSHRIPWYPCLWIPVQHGMIQVHAPSSLWSGTSDTKRKLRAKPSELQEVAVIFARMVEGTYRPVTCEHGTSSLGLDISTQ